jgi:putative endonuclease
MRTYHVYIMASRSRALYTGVTRDLTRRVSEHKQNLVAGFTSRYKINRLVYYEDFRDTRAAIVREKQIKGWLRSKKIALIESTNPMWQDLSEGWYGKSRCFAALSMTADRVRAPSKGPVGQPQ